MERKSRKRAQRRAKNNAAKLQVPISTAPRSNFAHLLAFVFYFEFLYPLVVGVVLGASDCESRKVGVFCVSQFTSAFMVFAGVAFSIG
jgi:hypothetical protein